jgi:hypothetical protein
MGGPWGLVLLYDIGLVLTLRLLHFAVDPESSWSGAVARTLHRVHRRLHDRFERPRGRPIELIAQDVRVLGHHLRAVDLSPAAMGDVTDGYDAALAEACAALGVEHLLGVLGPGTERNVERHRVEARLATAGLHLEGAG